MPDLPVLVGWLLVGWFCGTPFPHHPPSPIHPPSPTVPPNPILPPNPIHPPAPGDPGPWWQRWVVLGVLGAIGGLLGGYVFGQLFKIEYATAAGILLSFAGSFVGARLVTDIGGFVMPSRR
jgi:uncharacterized membrane protein YeaQ/YmgE (transglycosylase-associated protein family)